MTQDRIRPVSAWRLTRAGFTLLALLLLSGAGACAESAKTSFAIRGTLPWHNFLSGPTAWDEKDYERYLDRMKELGLNYVTFHCYTGGAERYASYVEPLIRIEYRSVIPEAGFDTSLTARWGYRPLPVSEFAFDTAKLFRLPRGATAFGARCAVLARTNEERYERAQALMRRVNEMAHARGIQVGLGFEFGIHPPEFASIVPPDSWIRGAMLPDPTHPASIEILRATIDDILCAYAGIDWIWLWLHEHTMHVGKAQPSGKFRELLQRDAQFFGDAGSEEATFTGVWSLAYVRLAQDYLAHRGPKVRLAISGWGGGTQLPGTLRGLDRALPTNIVFTCLNPGQGTSPQPPVLAKIARHREVWAIPWLEGDAQLWHLQPRVNLLREHVQLARTQRLNGVIAIHWRTEETRANLDAFARFARDPDAPPTVEEFYQRDCEQQFGQDAAAELAPLLTRLDREQALATQSPEYYPYDPGWGRLKLELRSRLAEHLATVSRLADHADPGAHRTHLRWLADNLQFTLLLDEVSHNLEPAYRLKESWLRGEIDPAKLPAEAASARQVLAAAPVENLFRTFARRVRSKGELGELSSLNQRVWLQYRELDDFLRGLKSSSNSASVPAAAP
ncbi:MAG: hypothetical protein ACYDH9_03035 [Limisphaerales bacterium]